MGIEEIKNQYRTQVNGSCSERYYLSINSKYLATLNLIT